MRISYKRYAVYLMRWQLSTPILAPIMGALGYLGPWWSASIANLIGGLIFFWVDSYIFRAKSLAPKWEIQENIECSDCHRDCRGYRLVQTENYDRQNQKPEFRCEECSIKKTEDLRKQGIQV